MIEGDLLVARVIGIDPGKATGVAVVDLVHNSGTPQCYPLLRNFAIRPVVLSTVPWQHHSKTLRIMIQVAQEELDKPLVIVQEHYTVTSLTQQSQDTQSLEVIGSVEGIIDIMDIDCTYCKQLPSGAKLLMKDNKLRDWLNLDLTGTTDHARDALRHAATWCVAYVHNDTQIVKKGE